MYWGQKLETLPLSEIDKARLGAFKRLINVAYTHCPFYREMFRERGLRPSEFRKLEDICQIPLTRPQDLINDPKAFRPDQSRISLVTCSGGTYRKPKKIYRTAEDILNSVETAARMFYTCGVRDSDSVAVLQSFGIWGIALLALEACRRIGCNCLPIGVHMNDDDVLELLQNEGVTVIYAVPSNAVRLTKVASMRYDMLRDFSVNRILLAGERITETQRRILASTWGADIFSIYGSEETDGLGAECEGHSGIHFCYDQFIAEVLDAETQKPRSVGEAGRLVITPLNHFGTVLLRYDIGDVVRFSPSLCECGRTSPLIEIVGRSEESISLITGVKLSAYQIEDFLLGYLGKIPEFQIIRERKGDGDYLRLLLEGDEDNESCRQIGEKMETLSLDLHSAIRQGLVNIEVSFVSQQNLIRTVRGKTPRFIDKGETA